VLTKWSTDKNYHVRRLVSEGTRPLLPWSGRLTIDATIPLPLLDTLHADPTRYVTRSVSNHLNDIAKTKPKLVLETLTRWKSLGQQDANEFQWMCRHSLRTLVKQGNEQALRFLGYRPNPRIEVNGFQLTPANIKRGDTIEFAFTIKALREEPLMVDYVIDFVKANGKVKPKVHKLKQINMRKGEMITIKKRHFLKADATTFTLYPGKHRITLQINGKSFSKKSFLLL
jgi:3-methyladenine DNA glycosylase AlkC